MKTIRTVPKSGNYEGLTDLKFTYSLKDSLKSIEIVQKAADIQTNYEIAQNKLK
jgi:hypothetical protein